MKVIIDFLLKHKLDSYSLWPELRHESFHFPQAFLIESNVHTVQNSIAYHFLRNIYSIMYDMSENPVNLIVAPAEYKIVQTLNFGGVLKHEALI